MRFHQSTGSQNTKYPKRVLDVRNSSVRLCEDLALERYACLSHCWGSTTEMIKTTMTTLGPFQHAVPRDALPRTFRDAIEICRRLEIHFLWIDSLCIIQDSDEDWKEQASRMVDIFENAFITIASTWADNSSRGCFSHTDAQYLAKQVNGYDGFYIRQLPRRIPSPCHDGIREQFPLLFRAWTFQELLLSPRVLYFCAQQVEWHCHTSRRSECRLEERQKEVAFISTEFDHWKLSLEWQELVRAYSRRQLTFERDRLPAIAAIAKRFQNRKIDDRFLAGLWEKIIVTDLAWYLKSKATKPRAHTFRIPTWSWASVQGEVRWRPSSSAEIPKDIEVVDIKYITSGDKLTDDILNATITFRARLIPVSYPPQASTDGHGRSRDALHSDNNSRPGSWICWEGERLLAPNKIMAKSWMWDSPFQQDTFSGYILPLTSFPDHCIQGHVDGLILQPQGDLTYVRVGYIHLWWDRRMGTKFLGTSQTVTLL